MPASENTELGFEEKWYQEYINIGLRKEVQVPHRRAMAWPCCV